MIKLSLAVVLLVLLSACESTRPVHSIANAGDRVPLVYSKAINSANFSNLENGEAIGIATGSDTAIARPLNSASITVSEKIESLEEKVNQPRDCDLDDDGIDDVLCPVGGDVKEGSPDERFILASVTFVKNERGRWTTERTVVRDEISGTNLPAEFRLVFVNTGNKNFDGRITAYDRLPQAFTFSRLIATHLTYDQRSTKRGLSFVPYVRWFNWAMDDFSLRQQVSAKATLMDGNIVKFETDQMTLEPGYGLVFEFAVDYALPY